MCPTHSRTPAPRGYLAGPRVVGYTLAHAALSSATTSPSCWSVLVDVRLRRGNFTGRGVVMGDEVVTMRKCGVIDALRFLKSLCFCYLGY